MSASIDGLRDTAMKENEKVATLTAELREVKQEREKWRIESEKQQQAKARAEVDVKMWKDKQEKLVELLHQMENRREKKAPSKKEVQLSQQCQEMKDNIETLTCRLTNMKEDHEIQLVHLVRCHL